jgi:tetratricopeptide (TPR) repeat protein
VHELLARIALGRRDAASAREQGQLAATADPRLPLPQYVDARLLYDKGHYEAALPLFEAASGVLLHSKGRPIAELHYYTAETLRRLNRDSEAEDQLLGELADFPDNLKARAALATLYHESGRSDEAVKAVASLMEIAPTADGYLLASRLLADFGERQKAAMVQAEAQRFFKQ